MPKEALLKSFVENRILLEAVRELILDEFADDVREDMSDEQMGQLTRLRVVGRKKVEQAFMKLEKYKTLSEENSAANPAR